MKTREIYLKIVSSSDIPMGYVAYTYKDVDGAIHLGKNIILELRTDEKTVSESIEKMKEVEKSEGFLFWNNSPEGEKFFKDNAEVIGSLMANMVLNQK